MEEWNKVYLENRRLDETYIKRYGSDPKYYEKNCLGLLVEIGELANETKCFKYWSIKKADKDDTLEEYADCITLIFCIFTKLNISIENIPEHYYSNDIIEMFNEVFNEASKLMHNKGSNLAKLIFSNLLHIGKLLEFSSEEQLDACYKKMKKLEERLNSDY